MSKRAGSKGKRTGTPSKENKPSGGKGSKVRTLDLIDSSTSTLNSARSHSLQAQHIISMLPSLMLPSHTRPTSRDSSARLRSLTHPSISRARNQEAKTTTLPQSSTPTNLKTFQSSTESATSSESTEPSSDSTNTRDNSTPLFTTIPHGLFSPTTRPSQLKVKLDTVPMLSTPHSLTAATISHLKSTRGIF